jgi:acyl-CoA dehydrogenase
MSDIRELVAESIERMLSERISRSLLLEFEGGKWLQTLWQTIEESGFTRVLVPESMGGTGGGWPDAFPVLRAVGFYRVPVPLAETVIGNDLLARVGMPVTDGPLSLIQQENGLKLARRNGGIVVDGEIRGAPWARVARWLVIAGRVDGAEVLLRVDPRASGIAIKHGHNVAHEPRDELVFKAVAADDVAFIDGRVMDQPVKAFGALARAIGMAGALESILNQSVEYAQERVQFGRPIAKFQAIQHMLAQLASEATAASTAAQAACNVMHKPEPRFEIAVAKVRAGQAAGVATRIAHQIHGAMGMTYEHTLHFGTRRLWSWRAEYGNESTWALELGARTIRRRGENFWADLTARSAV